MSEIAEPKTLVHLYWKIWLILVFLLLIARFVVFKYLSENTRFTIVALYMILTWISIGVTAAFEGNRFMTYLKEHHKDKWDILTSFEPFGGPGTLNNTGFFIFSKNDFGDPIVREYKNISRKWLIFVLTVFFTFPILFLICMLG
jgi:hypothetical protein